MSECSYVENDVVVDAVQRFQAVFRQFCKIHGFEGEILDAGQDFGL
jgi:hypothetical protein